MAHRLAPEAEADLADIWYYTAVESGNPYIADRFIDSLTQRCYLLATHPHVGRVRDELRLGLRSFRIGRYLILYRVAGDDVLILKIVAAARDLDSLL